MTQPADRLQSELERVLGLIMPRVLAGLSTHLQWEYRVILTTPASPGTPAKVACVPVDVGRCPFGPLTVPMWRDSGGLISIPVPGSIVVVAFHDGNPAKPAIVATDPSVPFPPTAGTYVPPAPLSLVGALTTFATGLNPGTLAAKSVALVATLAELL